MKPRLSEAGFTLIEAAVVVTSVGVMAALCFALFSDYKRPIETVKLENDVATVNSAVSGYLASGGSLDSITDPEAVIAKLKTTTSNSQAMGIVGLKGSFLDRRLTAVMQSSGEAATEQPRAVWIPSKKRFGVTTSGSVGVKEFLLGAASGTATQESRSTLFQPNTGEKWLWNYEDSSPPNRETYSDVAVNNVSPTAATYESNSAQLQAPEFSLAGDSYSLADYDLKLSISNPNPEGSSQLMVTTDGSTWQIHSSGAVPVAPGMTVSAYAQSSDDTWSDSTVVTETYEAIPEALEIHFSVPKLSVNFAEVGGAMIPGQNGTSTVPLAPGWAELANTVSIPAKYQNDSVFTVRWTYDGSDPSSSNNRQSAPAFSKGFPGQSIDYALQLWGGASVLPIQAAAESLDSTLVTTSAVTTQVLHIDPISLRPPVITLGDSDITIELVTEHGDTPVGARIFYTVDGSAPGDLDGSPTSGTLYTGPISVGSVPYGNAVKARVFAPDDQRHWFTASAVTTSPAITGKGNSLWALAEDGNGKLVEFRNYDETGVAVTDWGSISFHDNGNPTPFTSPSELESLAITDAGVAYFVRNSATSISGTLYLRPLFRIDVEALKPGDTPVATLIGDLADALHTLGGGSEHWVTGLAIHPTSKKLFMCYDGSGSNDSLFTIDSFSTDASGQLDEVSLVGVITGNGEVSGSVEDICFAADGSLYAADASADKIYHVDSTNANILSVHSSESGESKIEAIAIHPGTGEIVISETNGQNEDSVLSVNAGNSNNTLYFDYYAMFGLSDIEGMAFYSFDIAPTAGTGGSSVFADFCGSALSTYGVSVLNGAKFKLSHDDSGILGSVSLAPGATWAISAGAITDTFAIHSGNTGTGSADNQPGPGGDPVSPVTRDLAHLRQEALDLSAQAAALPTTQSFNKINASTTITANAPDGMNVIAINEISLGSGTQLTLSGGANDYFVLNIASKIALTGGSTWTFAGGLPPSHVILNMLPGSGGIKASGGSAALTGGIILAPHTSNSVELNGASQLSGAIVAGSDFSLSGGSQVVGSACGG